MHVVCIAANAVDYKAFNVIILVGVLSTTGRLIEMQIDFVVVSDLLRNEMRRRLNDKVFELNEPHVTRCGQMWAVVDARGQNLPSPPSAVVHLSSSSTSASLLCLGAPVFLLTHQKPLRFDQGH